MDLHRQIIDDAGIRPLDRAIYDQMVALGAFDGMKVELIEGVLVPMSPQGAPHSHVIKVLTDLLVRALHGRADVLIQSPFAANDVAEPEPDVAIVPMGDWSADHPDHAHLLIEVAVSSQRFDRGSKAQLYAASRVDEYWIVDVPAGTVTVYADSSGGAWRTMTTHAGGAVLSIRAFPDVQVQVAAILPSAR